MIQYYNANTTNSISSNESGSRVSPLHYLLANLYLHGSGSKRCAGNLGGLI